jgi:Ca-activated chloride channel family protein
MIRLSQAKPILIILALMALALFAAGCSPSAAGLTQEGNEAFAKQAYDEALQAYQAAQSRMPELAEPHYNAAGALYRQGKYPEAAQELEKALQLAKDDIVAQQSHYNQGNAAYNEKQWDAAIESYKQALLQTSGDADAKYNLELAMQQQDQQEQEQQNQDQQQQNQQNQDQQQQDQQQQDQQNQDQQNQDQQNQDQQQQDQQQQDQQNQDQQDQQSQDQQQDQQSQDQQNQDQQQQDQQSQNQQQGQPDPKQQDPKQPAQGSQLAPGQRMTQDQARQLLAAIARKSDTLQRRLGEYLNVRGRMPVQDW